MLIEGENVASVVLNDFGITLDSARMEAIRLLGLQPSEVGPAPKEQPDTEQDVNWDSVLTPNVPPLSETGRKVRKGLAWGTPVLILAGGLGILFYENHPALPLGGASIFVALVYLNLLAWLFFVALFRLQAFILELLIILPVCSLPVGVALNMDQSVEVNRWIIGAIGVLLLAGGSVWGLSLAQRSGERRSWPRLGFIALGWGLSLGITAFPLLFLSLFSRRPLLTTAGEHILAAVFAAIAVVGLIVENRCAKRYGPMRVW
jgi:hypothetical protein